MASLWKTVRVFISSTFRDMHAERDLLVKEVFPRLRQWCEERRLHLVDIDLRWGVTKEQADNGKALDICLQEIDGSRPFFVCFLGGRYGWVPDDLPTEELYRLRGLQAKTHHSITHLEILHAALAPIPTREGHLSTLCDQVFFYFRKPESLPDPDSLDHLTTEQREEYRATFFERTPTAGMPDRGKMLADLKAEVRKRFHNQNRVVDYQGEWDPTALNPEDDRLVGRLTALEELGHRVEEDIKRGVREQFAEHLATLDQQPSALDQERALHEAFIENRTRSHVPRPAVHQQLTDYANGTDSRPLIVTGPPGSGKSALLAHWIKDRLEGPTAGSRGSFLSRMLTTVGNLIRKEKKEAIIARFIGASPASTNLQRLLESLCEDLRERFQLTETITDAHGSKVTRPLAIPTDPMKLQKEWHHFLEEAGKRQKVILILDAINQLDRTADPLHLDWIPQLLPPGVRLMISALDHGKESLPETIPEKDPDWLAQLRRLQLKELPVPPLEETERRQILHEVPNVFAKTLDQPLSEQLIRNPATFNPLFLTVAFEELRVFGSFEKLPQRIAQLPQADMAQLTEPMEVALGQMFDQVLDRLERETKAPDLVPTLFQLMASAREGLSEQEMQPLLATLLPTLNEKERNGTLQVILRQIRAYLMRKGIKNGFLIDFYHRTFWKSVRSRYLQSPELRVKSHRALATFFAAQPSLIGDEPNERKVSEQVWQILHAIESSPTPSPNDTRLLEQALTDPTFLRAKCDAGLAVELAEDFHQAHRYLPDRTPLLQALFDLLEAAQGAENQTFNIEYLHFWFAYRGEKQCYLDLLALADSLDDSTGTAPARAGLVRKCRGYLANFQRRSGSLEDAERLFGQLLQDVQSPEHYKERSLIEYELGYIDLLRGDYRSAAKQFQESADHGWAAPDAIGGWISKCVQLQTELYQQMRESLQAFQQSGAHQQKPGETPAQWLHRCQIAQAESLKNQPEMAQYQSSLEEACTAFTEAAAQRNADPRAGHWLANVKAQLLQLAFIQRETETARSRLHALMTDERVLRNKVAWSSTYEAEMALLEDRWELAEEQFQSYIQNHPAIFSDKPEGFARVYLYLGQALAAQGKVKEAEATWQEGLALLPNQGNHLWQEKIRAYLEGMRKEG